MTRAELERNIVEAKRLAERWSQRKEEAKGWEAYWLREAHKHQAAIHRLEKADR